MSYAVVRTDKMWGTDNRVGIVSVQYNGASSTKTAIENGNVVVLSGLLANEREIYKGITPAVNSAIQDIVLIATPEVMYDERKKSLDEFRNEAGDIARGYRLHSGDIFSVTADALTGSDMAVGNVVELQAATKLKVVSSATSGSTLIGSIIAIETVGPYKYYTIEVA